MPTQAMERKQFILQSLAASIPILVTPLNVAARTPEDPEPYHIDVVKEFVIAAMENWIGRKRC